MYRKNILLNLQLASLVLSRHFYLFNVNLPFYFRLYVTVWMLGIVSKGCSLIADQAISHPFE